MRVRVLSRYTQVVKQSNSVSLETQQLRRKWLARRNSHASLACRTSSSPQKLKIFGDPAYFRYRCGSTPMKKTMFDLLHSLDIKIQYIQ